MRNFKELLIWQKSHSLCLRIYKITLSFPKEELYGIVSQMRRSSSSIATNIAEGCGRNSNPDFRRFLTIASGSASELEYQLLLAKDLIFITEQDFLSLSEIVTDVRKMIYTFSLRIK
ncbi:MAG: four helix bundle protein [Chitinophagales bacterium]|nr:four helix bundle protein [Chitinophagales bacterium]